MDFLAHFSTEENDRNGSFSMLVSAPDAETAIEKFKEKILETKKSKDILDGIKKVYLEVNIVRLQVCI